VKAPKKRICILAAAAALIAVGVTAAPSFASSGFTLELSPPPGGAVVGQPAVMHANGSIPVQDLEFPYWFSLDAIPTSVATECPPDAFEGMQLATSTGGSNIILTQREATDGNGNFSIPVGITPSAPGTVLLCGYTDDGAATTLAVAPLLLKIAPAGTPPSSGGGRRSSGSSTAAAVKETKSGVKMCLALLSRKNAKSCIHDAVARGKSRCRKIHSHKTRAKCVRAVKRAGRA
jgi:hypothetical protein